MSSMNCKCGNDEHEPVRFALLWGVGDMFICPNEIITEVVA
jgi:hypothetical protein